MDREVNRLYWKTAEPVTRLAAQLEISRGTFYNHLRPLSADTGCSACGGRLLFRTRSSRDSGDAHCEACGADERVAGTAGSAPAAAKRTASGARSAPGNRSPASRRATATKAAAAGARKPRAGQEAALDAEASGLVDGASRMRSRLSAMSMPHWLEEDQRRTQLLVLAVGTAALGLGILYYSRHRS